MLMLSRVPYEIICTRSLIPVDQCLTGDDYRFTPVNIYWEISMWVIPVMAWHSQRNTTKYMHLHFSSPPKPLPAADVHAIASSSAATICDRRLHMSAVAFVCSACGVAFTRNRVPGTRALNAEGFYRMRPPFHDGLDIHK